MRKVAERFLCIEFQMGAGEVATFAAEPEQFSWRYIKTNASPVEALRELKQQAFKFGATLEAIQLLELTPQEEASMADKLSKKTADTKALKDAAKAAPVKGKAEKAPAAEKAPRKGNPEAPAKAREARANKGPDTRKIKVINKAHGAREGTKRAQMLDIVLKAKTVQEALDAGATMIDVRFAESKEFISLG